MTHRNPRIDSCDHLAANLRVWLRRPVIRLLLIAGLLATTSVFFGSVSTGDRSGVASVSAAELPVLNANTATVPAPSDTAMGASQVDSIEERAASQTVRATRKKARCTGCAVVESVYRSDRPERVVGACFSADWASSLVAVAADDSGAYRAISTVGVIVAAVAVEPPASMPLAPVRNYQIVVRMADGSRVVFNEPTARRLQAGERILVIAGATAPAF